MGKLLFVLGFLILIRSDCISVPSHECGTAQTCYGSVCPGGTCCYQAPGVGCMSCFPAHTTCCGVGVCTQDQVCCTDGPSIKIDQFCCYGKSCCVKGYCCPKGQTCCKGQCCPEGQICCNGKCCPKCYDCVSGVCCPIGSKKCGKYCLTEAYTCCDGTLYAKDASCCTSVHNINYACPTGTHCQSPEQEVGCLDTSATFVPNLHPSSHPTTLPAKAEKGSPGIQPLKATTPPQRFLKK